MDGKDDQRSSLDSAIQHLIACTNQVGRVPGHEPWRQILLWLTRGRWGRHSGWPVIPRLDTPWQDTASSERPGWRMRAANLRSPGCAELDSDGYAFTVDYQVCRRCRIGWVEQPYTLPPFQRRGLATAGLAALRAEYPGFEWHTLGGHIDGSPAFWDTVGTNVPGGYRQRTVCPHITAGG